MCWLPQDVFVKYGSDLHGITQADNGQEFQDALGHLIGVARSHLRNALSYTLLIPKHETGLRRFCLWALGMAVLTLRKINNNRAYLNGNEVKITRSSVKATIITTNLLTRSDLLLKLLFNATSRSLPMIELNQDNNDVENESL
jgi:farnesyl-diphosphate farnesyltransferase